MLFRQFVDDDLGCGSYLIGNEDSGEAVAVDPAYAVEQYLEQAERDGVRILRVLETHTHADHVSGHGRLALEHGVPVSIHPAAEPEFPFDPLEDGGTIELGPVCLRVLHTPGHRPEHCCFEVIDRERGDEPWLTLTGDSLFVGDAARPDLASEAAEGAHGLYRSLQRLMQLEDGVEVYPGHVSGSLCGTGMSSKASSTIGFERRFNQKLRMTDEDEFVAGHALGALSVPVDGGNFATKAAFVLPLDERVVIHAADAGEAQRAATGLRAVGIFDLAGYLVGPPREERTAPVELDELRRLVKDDAVELLDVREPHERDEGYIPGSRNIPYRLVREWADDLQGGKPVVTICSSGPRAGVAASVLTASGVDARPVLHGGIPDWEGETVSFRRCGS
jgi:glyoxylase-like metal-dependent hydrolase (beta-lactamase superfamily II)